MFKLFITSALISAAFLSGCTVVTTKETIPGPLPKTAYLNEDDTIRLQNLKTRMIVVCRESIYETAETCARFYERHRYVRLKDIPFKVAKYDRLTKDTFPTRRWRNGERTPRW